MTNEQKQLVKDTVPVLREHGVLLTTHFYKRMFQQNPELKNIFNMGNQQNNKQQAALAMAVLAYAEHIEDPSVLLPVIDGISHKHVSLDIRPEHYSIVGRHLIASIKEVLGDAARPALLEAWTIAYDQLASLMGGHEQGIYNRHTQQEGGWTGWRPFIVKQKQVESDEITSFYLYPADGGAVESHQPGQYISVRLFLPELNLLQPRQYSISCAANGSYYRISVKREAGSKNPNGMISNRLHDHIEIGDTIEVTAPAGTFILNKVSNSPRVFISGGVGQTPLLSMLEESVKVKEGLSTPITWIHGCRSEAVHAFKETLSEFSRIHKNVDQHVFYEQPATPGNGSYEGWVDLGQIRESVLKENAEYYICGPGPFITLQYKFLVENGVPGSSIHFEEFGPQTLQLN